MLDLYESGVNNFGYQLLGGAGSGPAAFLAWLLDGGGGGDT